MWGCGRRGKPGVYTKVSFYSQWIFEVIDEVKKSSKPVEQAEAVVEDEQENELISTAVDLSGESMLSKVVTDYSCSRYGEHKKTKYNDDEK